LSEFSHRTLDYGPFVRTVVVMSRSTICSGEIENKLYPDYDDGMFQRMYIELKEEKG
jgi:hypothetical protein